MNAIAFLVHSLLTSVFSAIVIEFIRTGYGFTQGEFAWFDSFVSSWIMALGIHAIEFIFKLTAGAFVDTELPDRRTYNQYVPAKRPTDYGAPLQ
jgi:hypothetical protein